MRDRVSRTRLAVALAVLAGALGATAAPAFAVEPSGLVCTDGPTFNLTARAGSMETPDGNSNLMWSYSVRGGDFQTPGPVMCVDEGDTVTVSLHNALSEPTSIIFPGQSGVAASGSTTGGLFAQEAPPGGDVTYTFKADKPGTFIYESGSDPAKQVEMGLASALVVRPRDGANFAYDDPTTKFNGEYLILLNDIDSALHSAVENGEPYDITARHDRYYTINGRSFPDTLQDNGVPWLDHQPYGALVHIKPYDPDSNPDPVLIRILNVGLSNHPFHPHGENLQFIAQDGRQIKARNGNDAVTEHFGETVPSGSTQDYLLSFRDQDHFGPGHTVPVTFPSYRDLTFKDSNTWYSGSPYLGQVGKLPSTTVSQNICGAFFFPWHSHALNEFANYDAGFGGMATLLRVDPLQGCGVPGLVTRTKSPDSVTVTTGSSIQSSSSLASNLATANGGLLTGRAFVNSTTSGTRTAAWYATFTGVPAAGVQNLKVYYTGRNRRTLLGAFGWTPGCSQTVRIWRWPVPGPPAVAGGWVNLDTQTVGGTDVAIADLLPAGPDSKYIGTGGNAGQVRVGLLCSVSSTNFTMGGDFMQITYDAP